MAIRPDADEVYFSTRLEERQLALRLDEAFDVTFGSRTRELGFWLAEPKDHTKQRFGLTQEVLVIYSPFAKTDSRVLTAIAEVTGKQDFKYRVDQYIVLLIHKGSGDETAQLVRGRIDHVVVSFTANELLDPERGSLFVRARIAKELGAIDVFGVSSPITSDAQFFGRDDLVQSLMNRTVGQHQSVGLFGLRKTGKTSVLFAVQRRLQDRPVHCEYVDCQNPGVHSARWWQLLDVIAQRCLEAAGGHDGSATTGQFTDRDAGARFSAAMKRLLKLNPVEDVLLMLDEIEYITPGLGGPLGRHWDRDFVPFWQVVRATHQETQGRLNFVLSGVNPRCVEESHFEGFQNPVFQLASPQYLEPLSTSAGRDMVRSVGRYSGLRFQENVYGYLAEVYGGHPYLIRLACSEVWRSSGPSDPQQLTEISVESFQSGRDEIRSRLAQPAKDILLSLVWWYPEEYDLLRILAGGDAEFVAEYVKQQPQSVSQFKRYGLLKDDNEFAIAELKTFLIERGDEYKREISPFAGGDMPPELLPEIPDLDTLGRLFGKRTKIEIQLRKAIILYLGVKHSWKQSRMVDAIVSGLNDRKDGLDQRELFVGRATQDAVNELFAVELKSVIAHNWEIFGGLFDGKKDRFEMNMDTLNVARRVDSHTKPVTAQEAEEFENSYVWLLNRLSKLPDSAST